MNWFLLGLAVAIGGVCGSMIAGVMGCDDDICGPGPIPGVDLSGFLMGAVAAGMLVMVISEFSWDRRGEYIGIRGHRNVRHRIIQRAGDILSGVISWILTSAILAVSVVLAYIAFGWEF